jgi:hypothetical protein
MSTTTTLRWCAFLALGLGAGCAQLLGIEELSPGNGPSIDAMPPVQSDGGGPMNTCAIDNGGCDVNADCIDSPEGAFCQCREGFAGDGTTCIQTLELLTTFPDRDFYTGSGSFAVGVGSRLFFFPDDDGNDPDELPAFFTSYDFATGELREEVLPPADVNDFCACGLTQFVVGLDPFLYQIGNYGMQYDAVAQVWNRINYPPENQRGEAAGVVLGRRIYTFGGRDVSSRSVQFFEVDTGLWTDLGLILPWDMPYGGAAVAVEPNLIYVFGGLDNNGVANQAAVYDVAQNLWMPLPNLPDSAAGRGAGLAFGRPFVVGYNALYVVDSDAGAWSTIPLPAADFWYAATVQGEVFIVGDRNGQLEIQRLIALPGVGGTPLPPGTP